jgi:FtsP/CotA-like multicopper oxidase with cupredoxin domain
MRVTALIVWVIAVVSPLAAQQPVITDLPEVRGPFTLIAVYDSAAGHNAFAYAGKTVPPVIRVSPGSVIKLRYVNNLPRKSDEECATGPCGNMSNLHFHGLHVSPERPQDDVLTMMVMPGETLEYKVVVPSYSPPGLYWYHTHPHGESARQGLDGMSGAIVVEGLDRYYPELRQHARARDHPSRSRYRSQRRCHSRAGRAQSRNTLLPLWSGNRTEPRAAPRDPLIKGMTVFHCHLLSHEDRA